MSSRPGAVLSDRQTEQLHLAVDGGQTGTRFLLFQGGRERARFEGPGFGYHHTRGPHELIIDLVASARDQLGSSVHGLDTAALGLTGAPEDQHQRVELAVALRRVLGARRVLLTGDAVSSHAGALGGAPGVVVAAGTGAIALGLTGNGRWAQVDGWGYMLGDEGGGYWIGRSGLAEVLRVFDGRSVKPTLLVDSATTRFGPLSALGRRISESQDRVALVASFAVDVAAAARQGDEVARGIWAEAARHHARSARAAVEDLFADDQVAISWAGRLFDADDLLLEPFIRLLEGTCPNVVPTPPRGDALEGCLLLAGSNDGDLPGDLVTVVRA